MDNKLTQRNRKRTAVVAVIGLGYVGLPTAIEISNVGFKVIGIDVDEKKVKSVNAIAHKNLSATTDWRKIKDAHIILIAVPTPLTKNKTPDISAIENAAQNIASHLKKDTLVVLESTTYPGTTEEILKPALEKSGLRAGKDFFLAFAPERIDPGNKTFALTDVPKIIGGINKQSSVIADAFYKSFLKYTHIVSSPRTAEMTKLHENIFRLVNISLVNEMKLIADKMGIDFWEVIEAAKTKPYGFMPFYPGPGVGGHCIPLDPFYLSWKAREYNFFTRFIDLAGEINDLIPHSVVTKIIWALNKHRKPVSGSNILVLGVAYKKDIDDPRESPAIPIIWDLLRKNGNVSYNDPHVPILHVNGKTLRSVALTKTALQKADCVVILTDHSAYDYKTIAKTAKLIIDTRNTIKRKASHIIT